MDDFSWSDSFKAAFGPCLSCLRTTRDDSSVNEQTRSSTSRAELEGLLRDVGETNSEAETLSLHSNIGDRTRRKKRLPPKNITIFGYNLFGKPPIRLDGEDNLTQSGNHSRRPTISSSTLDLDAAPLDPSAIDRLSAAQLDERLAREEEERLQKAERRRKRRERKELERASLSLALNHEQEFEHFPASVTATYTNAPVYEEDFVQVDALDGEVEGADFEAEMYAYKSNGNSRRTDSDSRSRTSASNSNPDLSYNHHHISQQPGLASSLGNPRTRRLARMPDEALPKKRKSARSKTSSRTSQSESLLSPVNSSFPTQPTIAPHDQEEFEGFPNDGSFPIVGFGGGKTRKSNSDMGVALARRGDN